MADQPPNDSLESDSLESESLEAPAPAASPSSAPADSGASSPSPTAGLGGQPAPAASPPPKKRRGFGRKMNRANIYLLIFALLIVVATGIVVYSYSQSKKTATATSLSSKGLSATTLAQIANSDATVGSNGQVLNIQSSAVFDGGVVARQSLSVAGDLQVGGSLALNSLTANGSVQFGQTQITKNLQVAGDSTMQGGVSIAKSLQVSGGGNFGGGVSTPQLSTSSLQLAGDLTLSHHLVTSGGVPSHSNDTGLGNGGTASLSGTDTAGSIAINTGSSPAAGCFINVSFTTKFANTPHVIVTPIGSAAGGLAYYVNRSATGFSVCVSSAAPSGSSFGFDYIVID